MNENEKAQVTVVVLTYNEEANLPACLESLRGLDCEVFVVDSGSTDRTWEIAEAYGARVVEHPFETHARQWRWALDHLPLKTEWVLGLDADQRLTPELREELGRLFEGGDRALQGVDGFYVKRRQVFRGRWIRHGGYYPKYLLKLFRRDKVRLDDLDLVDHHFYVEGVTRTLRGDLIEENLKENDLAFWLAKHIRYARLLAEEEFRRRAQGNGWTVRPRPWGTPDERTAFLKHLWGRMPLYVRPFLYFVYRYFFRLGFLDGKEGFIFHFLQGFWFRLLVDIYLDELGRSKSQIANP